MLRIGSAIERMQQRNQETTKQTHNRLGVLRGSVRKSTSTGQDGITLFTI